MKDKLTLGELGVLPEPLRENYDKGSNSQGYKEGMNQTL